MIVADAYPYNALAEKRKNPVAIATSAPVLANFGAIAISLRRRPPNLSSLHGLTSKQAGASTRT